MPLSWQDAVMSSRLRSIIPAIALICVVAGVTATAALAGPVPGLDQKRIVAEFGSTYMPGTMPPGYIYIRWETQPGSADAYGDRLLVWFGKHGRLVQWNVENSQDPEARSYQDCTRRSHFGGPGSKTFHFGGKTVYYAGGAVGQDATVCLPNHQAVVAWNDYSLSAATLARVAASARPVG
jgi:hypothetical protein